MYDRFTAARDGYRKDNNMGHTVNYFGQRAGLDIGQGFRGTWCIVAPNADSGSFHIWPVMQGWQALRQVSIPTPSAPPAATVQPGYAASAPLMEDLEGGNPIPIRFAVTSDNICAVCFERPIDVCFLPCSHVAACSSCASQLRPASCPICRAPIASIS